MVDAINEIMLPTCIRTLFWHPLGQAPKLPADKIEGIHRGGSNCKHPDSFGRYGEIGQQRKTDFTE